MSEKKTVTTEPIKYHQWDGGREYGEDHMLTNNWNPNNDYGNEYVRGHFNIETPSYKYDSGFTTAKDREMWSTEVSNLIASLGIRDDSTFKAEHSDEKQAYLYAHPQQISGVIKKNDVKKVANAINQMDLSSLRWVDLYDTVYAITDEEYQAYLESQRERICTLVRERAATTRTYKYADIFDVAISVARTVKMQRLGLNDSNNYTGGQTVNYVNSVIYDMINKGALKHSEKNGREYIRSLNKTERRRKVSSAD